MKINGKTIAVVVGMTFLIIVYFVYVHPYLIKLVENI